MRNIARINNYYNRLQAWRDWEALANKAKETGVDVAKYAPQQDAGWRKIDKAIGKLRQVMEKEN